MNLILSPHWDDEVLGCASFLNSEATVLYFTQGLLSFPGWRKEMDKVYGDGGFQRILLDFPIHHLDAIAQAGIITNIEHSIATYKPETVLIPFSSYNQDHHAIHDAALTAMRPNDKQHFVKRILVYEEPDVFGTMASFKPNYFKPLDIDRKVRLCGIYESQMRGHRSADLLRAIAQIRGMQAQIPSAEAFEVLRWVE